MTTERKMRTAAADRPVSVDEELAESGVVDLTTSTSGSELEGGRGGLFSRLTNLSRITLLAVVAGVSVISLRSLQTGLSIDTVLTTGVSIDNTELRLLLESGELNELIASLLDEDLIVSSDDKSLFYQVDPSFRTLVITEIRSQLREEINNNQEEVLQALSSEGEHVSFTLRSDFDELTEYQIFLSRDGEDVVFGIQRDQFYKRGNELHKYSVNRGTEKRIHLF